MMTHRAYLFEYMGAAAALDYGPEDRALAALPLYHTAQMHAFTMPQLLVGAETLVIEAPEPARVLELIERERITSFFAPPTVWIGLLRHEAFDRRDLSSLKRVYYGAAIMPVPVLHELRQRLPGALPYQGYGQSEIAPLATVLRPEDHDARPASAGRPVIDGGDARRRRGDARRAARRARRDRPPLAAAPFRLLGQARGNGSRLRGRLVPLRRRRHGG